MNELIRELEDKTDHYEDILGTYLIKYSYAGEDRIESSQGQAYVTVKEKIPKAPIYIWSGYTYEHLKHTGDPHVRGVLEIADYLIDGPYIQELRDVTLPMRGSSNQNIIDLKQKL